MGSLLFSPDGRIDPDEFMRGALILIIIILVLGLLPLVSLQLSLLLSIPSMVIFYCWIVLWAKRYRGGDKKGRRCIIPILVWIVLSVILGLILPVFFGVDVDQVALEADVNDLILSGEIWAAFGLALRSSMESARTMAIPNSLASAALSYGIVYFFNQRIPYKPA